jgi:hypothetical protein
MSTISVLPTVVDLVFYHGDTFTVEFDITNYTIPATPTWNCAIKTGSTITTTVPVTNVDNIVTLNIPKQNSALLSPGTTYSYDIQMTKTNTVRTLIKGTITVVQDITPAVEE